MIYSVTSPSVTLPPTSVWSCTKAEFGQISHSFASNSGAILLKRPKNLAQTGSYPRAPSLDAAHQFTLPSLRSVRSDRLLEQLIPSISEHLSNPGNEKLNENVSVANRSIAVLPFANHSSLVEDQYFSDGIHDDLLTSLSRESSLVVISRTSVMRYPESELSIPQMASERWFRSVDTTEIFTGWFSGNTTFIFFHLRSRTHQPS